MTRHGKARRMLYDYVRGELGQEETRLVNEHIGRCRECSEEADGLRSLLLIVPDASKQPSAGLPDSYWTGFANEVMGKIGKAPVSMPGIIDRIAGVLGLRGLSGMPAGLPVIARRLSLGLAAAAAAAVVLYFALPELPGSPEEPGPTLTEGVAQAHEDSLTAFDRRLSEYFRRSKTLLVGVSNIDPAGGQSVDLDAERRISRSLLREARYLRTGPVDSRSYSLMSDLDQVMIGFANSDAGSPSPAVDMIRGGIENKNLLFKLRMQETRQYRTPVQQASYRQ